MSATSSRGHRAGRGHRDRRRRLRLELTDAGVPQRIIDVASDRMARYQLTCRQAGVPALGADDVAHFAVRHHPLKPETIDLIVDEFRRQGRPIPGGPR